VTSPTWEEAYHRAVLETDGKKMPERIAAARQAISKRLADTGSHFAPEDERQRMAEALRRLSWLEAETWRW
jgi:hypothetical protein